MIYTYELSVYEHNMSVTPDYTEQGIVKLACRPLVGEEIKVNGKWHKIKTIRHTDTGIIMVLEGYYSDQS